MRIENETTSSTSTRSPATTTRRAIPPKLESAFTAAFLSRSRHLAQPPEPTAPRLAGSWDVEPIERGDDSLHAVVRRDEPMAAGGGAVAIFRDRSTALLAAAALTALAAPNRLHVNRDRPEPQARRLGLPLHDGTEFLGHLTPKLCPGKAEEEEGLLPHLHTLRALAANPQAVALLLEALGPDALPILGRAVMRRVG